MEILELEKRISRTLELVNNAESVSTRRRYYVELNSLVSIYSQITNRNININTINNTKMMKYTFIESLLSDLTINYKLFCKISSNIMKARKEADLAFQSKYVYKNYSPKFLGEIVASFFASLGPKYFDIYYKTLSNDRIFFNKSFGTGYTIFDYQDSSSYIFVNNNFRTLLSAIVLVHEFGHAFEYDYTKYSRKTSLAAKFNVTLETFPLLMELLFLDYLKRIKFNQNEIHKLEEEFYKDIISFTSELRFAFLISNRTIDSDGNLVIFDDSETEIIYSNLKDSDDFVSYSSNINVENSVNYMCGGFIATIYNYYCNQDLNFIKDIEKHFLDYEFYNSSEVIDKLPFVKEEIEKNLILSKKLRQIKTNQF